MSITIPPEIFSAYIVGRRLLIIRNESKKTSQMTNVGWSIVFYNTEKLSYPQTGDVLVNRYDVTCVKKVLGIDRCDPNAIAVSFHICLIATNN